MAMHHRTPMALALLLLSAGATAVRAASERDTALVTIADANAHCLIQSGMMPAEKARNLVSRFLDAEQVSAKQRKAVRDDPGFSALMDH